MRTDIAHCECRAVIHAADQHRLAQDHLALEFAAPDIARQRRHVPAIAQEHAVTARGDELLGGHCCGGAPAAGPCAALSRVSILVMKSWPLNVSSLYAQPDACAL